MNVSILLLVDLMSTLPALEQEVCVSHLAGIPEVQLLLHNPQGTIFFLLKSKPPR